mgnify:CR=1 FL=1
MAMNQHLFSKDVSLSNYEELTFKRNVEQLQALISAQFAAQRPDHRDTSIKIVFTQ